MATRMTYKVTYTYEDGSWSAISTDVPGAITWGRSLTAAVEHSKEAIATMLDLSDEEMAAIEIEPTYVTGDAGVDEILQTAAVTRAEATIAVHRAQAALWDAVNKTRDTLSLRDLAAVAGVSHGRIQQVEAELQDA